MSAVATLALLVALSQAPEPPADTPAAAANRSPTGSAAWSASDEEISRGLVAAHAQDPQRRVCATYTRTGERQRRSVCGTLQSWFNSRTEDEVRNRLAPNYLVEEVKQQRARARARRSDLN